MPAPYHYGMPPIPQQYQQPGFGGNPQAQQMMLAWLLAHESENPQPQQEMPPQGAPPVNPYYAQPFRPTPAGISPIGRFNDMVLRQSANIASRTADAKSAVNETSERQRLVDSITHPPPTAPYSISPTMSPTGAPNPTLSSRYGSGGVSFAPPGSVVHGTFGPPGDRLPFGNIGEAGPGAHEGLPSGDDPMQTTFQQQMILDAIAKATGKKKAA